MSIKQIGEDFARYLYLPRVSDPLVLLKAITDGVVFLTWEHDAFAIADSFRRDTVGYAADSSLRRRMPMRPGCSSSRLSRDNNLTQRSRNRAATERLSTPEPGERAPLPAKNRDPEHLHRTHQRRLSLCGSMGRSPSTRPAWGGMQDASRTRSSRTLPAW